MKTSVSWQEVKLQCAKFARKVLIETVSSKNEMYRHFYRFAFALIEIYKFAELIFDK